MKIIKIIFVVFGFVLLAQLILFYDYISPFHGRQVKVKGLTCTCPDESVLSGIQYLKSVTPDSLKKYDMDYSEIFVTERPSSNHDPMGVNYYYIKGEVIGKDRVGVYDKWNPILHVSKWREANSAIDWVFKGLFITQLIGWLISLRLIRKKIAIRRHNLK